MGIRLLAGKDGKEERQVGVVRVQQIQLAQVEHIVSRYGGEVRVELVGGFGEQVAIGIRKDADELGPGVIEFNSRMSVQNNGERKPAERFPVAQSTQAVAKVF